MRTTLRLLTLAALLMTGAGYLAADGAFAQPDPGIRYVDMQRCFDGYVAAQNEVVRLREELQGKMEAFEAREATLRGREGEMAVMDQASVEFASMVHRMESDQLTLDRDKQFALDLLQRQQIELYLRSYIAVQGACAQLGAREGFGAVMIIPDPPSDQPEDLAATLQGLQDQPLLWVNPNYDVTDLVLQVLNGN